MRFVPLRILVIGFAVLIAGCGSDDEKKKEITDQSVITPAQVRLLAQAASALGDPAEGLVAVKPDDDDLVKLGQILFFSKTLGGTFDSSCATCHHPDFMGGDGLSLPIGVNSVNPDFLGPGRQLDHGRDFDPLKDGGPNVPRNSLTILNTALYKSVFFFDGRVFVNHSEDGSSHIRTPDSGNTPDVNAGDTLLEAQARFPVASPDEMRNFFHSELTSGESFRQMLIGRLKGNVDAHKLTPDGPSRWLSLFRRAFDSPDRNADELITYPNVQKAIAAYQQSLVFVDSPWRKFALDNGGVLSGDSLKGAWLFMAPKERGGLGCAACHSGSFFTDEKFHNVGFPQIGRGKRADGRDFGRWQVTKHEQDRYAFRTPSLVNVDVAAPFGHAGTFQTLDEVLVYHANPRGNYATFDFSLRHLDQFIDGSKTYPNAYTYTREAVESSNLSPLLLHRNLSDNELRYIKSFLADLTDVCLRGDAKSCLSPWVPASSDNPDGNMLVRSFLPVPVDSGDSDYQSAPASYPSSFALASPVLEPLTGFPDAEACDINPSVKSNPGAFFVESASSLGVDIEHSFVNDIWFSNFSYNLADVAQSGGVTATYINDDCWPDIVFTGGSSGGLKAFENVGGGEFSPIDVFPIFQEERVTGVAFADIDGDFRREMFVGNLLSGAVKVMKVNALGKYVQSAILPMTRNTYGFAFGDYDGDGWPDIYMAHWDGDGLPGTAPALWRNASGSQLVPVDGSAGTAVKYGINQNFHFTPGFVDVDRDGWLDLLIAADFGSSIVLKNTNKNGFRFFSDATNRSVINDENGMGSAIGDIDNDGLLDWFVTSIYDPEGVNDASMAGNWGVTGNRLYRNVSTPGNAAFENISDVAGIADGRWGWGACMADFNHDGWLDILHVNGYGRDSITGRDDLERSILVSFYEDIGVKFGRHPPQLFLNNHNGTFTNRASSWGMTEPIDGKGIICFDYDRDGDVDVGVFQHTGSMKFYENKIGSGVARRFLALRLEGRAPLTEAIGARVTVVADINGSGAIEGGEHQVRVVAANSNYNSQNTTDIHFGLGNASVVQSIRIDWPDGSTQMLTDQPVNQMRIIRQP